MKAWHCFDQTPEYGSLLVFAENRNQARVIASKSIWSDDWEYVGISAIRQKSHDGLRSEPCAIESNDELPDDKKFYSETDIDGSANHD